MVSVFAITIAAVCVCALCWRCGRRQANGCSSTMASPHRVLCSERDWAIAAGHRPATTGAPRRAACLPADGARRREQETRGAGRARVLTPRPHCSARLLFAAEKAPDAGSCPGHVGVPKQYVKNSVLNDSLHICKKHVVKKTCPCARGGSQQFGAQWSAASS
jgi:hypothetical protein